MKAYLSAACLLGAALSATVSADNGLEIDSATFGALRARSIGPAEMSGRVSAIDADATDPVTIYVGSASGGVWKSVNGGNTYKPVFDDYTQSIGAIRIDPSKTKTVWVGSGESWVRNSVSIGNGVFKTEDGGDTWQAMGLAATEHIAEIEVSPFDGNTVFVCATGPAWNSASERGVFKTEDGGKTWDKVLYVDADTGCSDLAMDPRNPLILYAGMWQFRRAPDSFRSGGPGSALYRSVDGGASWQKLTKGLPSGEKGRIAVAIAPSRTTTVYALVEAKKTAIYRSDDMGADWQEMNSSSNVQVRPFYFGEIKVDPKDHLRVYRPALQMTFSDDGGKTFGGGGFGGTGYHPDLHTLWINPRDPNHMIMGTDGGVYTSRDRAAHWSFAANLPLSQFYHVALDQQWPYNVYGGLQDNGSWRGPSRTGGSIRNRDWDSVGYGDGFWVFPDPSDNNFVYSEYQGGKLLRVDSKLGEVKAIAPAREEGQEKLRFNWNTPLALSPTQAGVLYFGAQYLFRSKDRGDSWTAISPDLTSDDPKRQQQETSGGLSRDNSSAENNTTIYTISESPKDPNVVWVGTDDGNVQVTRDAGKTWRNVAGQIPGLPKFTWVSRVEASPHDVATVFVTFDGHRSGDMRPYLYRSTDFGATWTALARDPVEGYAWVVRQDLVNSQLLFLGTEFGLYISLDQGLHWARFKENLPKVAVHDIAIHPTVHDVVLATHGRGVYIIDDITPLRALSNAVLTSEVSLLPTRPNVMLAGGALQDFGGHDEFNGENPSGAAVIAYYLKKRHMFGDLKVLVYDQGGKLITTLPGGKRKGMNRVDWPMRLKAPKFPPSTQLVPGFVGPRVPEGSYRIELIKGKEKLEGSVVLIADPRSPHAKEDRLAQQELALALYAELDDLTYIADSLNDSKAQAEKALGKLSASDAKRVQRFIDAVTAFNNRLAANSNLGYVSGEEKLREHYGTLYGEITQYDGRPTQSQISRHTQLLNELRAAEKAADVLMAKELPVANRVLEAAKLPILTRPTRSDWNKQRETGGQGGAATKAELRGLLQVLPVAIGNL